MHLCNAKLIWDRISDVYEGHRTHQDPWFCEFKESLKTMSFKSEPSDQNYCLMESSVKVTSGDSKPSYKTLAKIATKQQTAMEHIQKLLDKSDDLLDAEMNLTQSLIEYIKSLRINYEDL